MLGLGLVRIYSGCRGDSSFSLDAKIGSEAGPIIFFSDILMGVLYSSIVGFLIVRSSSEVSSSFLTFFGGCGELALLKLLGTSLTTV
jgi:hypothetical protein